MDQILDYCIRYRLYIKGSPHASVSSSSKGKSKEKDMKVTSHWLDAPELDAKAPTAHETSLALFFNSVIEAVNKASSTVTVRMWTTDSATHPLNGGDAMRKPNLSCWLSTGSQFDWRHLASFAEVKNHGGKDNEKSSYIETARKASCLLYAQDGQHATPCIRILGPEIYLTIFDRSRSVSTHGYDINHCPHEFLCILIGITSAPNNILGFNISINWRWKQCDGKLVDLKELKIETGTTTYTIELMKILFILDNLCGRGMAVWEGVMTEKGTMQLRQVVVKDLWIDLLWKYMEGMILSILNVHNIEGIPTLIHKQQVQAPYPSTTTDVLPVGDLITEFSCLGELLVAFLDYVVAHKQAFEKAGILHRDISLVNLFLTSVTHRSNHREFIQRISGQFRHKQDTLCTRIGDLKWCGLLGDWGYAVPGAECITTTIANLETDQLPDGTHAPTLPVEIPAEFNHSVESSNCIPIMPVDSMNASTSLTPVSDLSKEDDIMLTMGPDTPENDPRDTIDTSPLYCTGTWSWMSAQLVMAGAGQPVIHNQGHDLETIFYVLVGICVLFNRPSKLKCDKDLVQCFDRYFNTFEPSVLKTITIQSDLTWQPFILQHISMYFQPIIPLLTRLQKGVILPLSTDNDGNVHCKVDFTHDMFISTIIETLLDLGPGAWTPVDQEGGNGDDSEPDMDHHETKSDLADLASDVNSSPADTPHESPKSISSSQLNVSTLPPMLPRPTSHQPSAGPGFYSKTQA
ncbi:hypothetical protein SCLCIDRAFT_29083 [Scleroderma citrinum Foug A]|uniref:Fungal-type protein kinase domain-containing protein n=1 Tax=Scleroderma citrinum Foug A TaxID=1036808 RepID=A0A0C2ZXF0_9AGAM|nr:hypothetical protein SCLCIDRAFT_29083 [Scleroderma citrinum Foug A]